MEDFSQLILPLPIEADPAASPSESPDSGADNLLFEALLAEAGLETSDDSRGAAPQTAPRTTVALPTTPAELGEEIWTKPSDAFQNTDSPDSEAGEFGPHAEMKWVDVKNPPVEIAGEPVDLSTAALPQTLKQSGEGEVARADPTRAETRDPIPDSNPEIGPSVPASGESGSEVAIGRQPTVGTTGSGQNEVLVSSGETPAGMPEGPVRESGVRAPIIFETGASNPFVRAGDGGTMGSLDLESFGVRRMEIQAVSNPAAAVPTKTPANSPDIAFGTAPARPEPTLEMLSGFSARNRVPIHFAVEPEIRPDIPVLAKDLANARPNATSESTLVGSELPIVGSGLESQVTSQYVWKETIPSRRQGFDSKSTVVGASLPTSNKESSGSIVQMTADIPRETEGSDQNAAAQSFRAAQPVKPVTPPTFSLAPARQVTMMVGESDAEVRVQLRENQGEVLVRFDAAANMRVGLQGSVHDLIESLAREQIPVSDVKVSGRFDTGTDSRQSQNGNAHSSQNQKFQMAEEEETSFLTDFESSAPRISLTA